VQLLYAGHVDRRSRTKRALWLALLLGGLGFAAYMIVFYGTTAARAQWQRWNEVLANLHRTDDGLPTVLIGLHLLTGTVLVVLGPLQLVPRIRAARPAVHRAIGRIYVGAAIIAGLAGNAFIYTRGTVGGPVMSIAFSIYGWLLVGAAVLAWRYGRQRDLVRHRAWALRLFALGISSMLYRLE
jgi:hypothetical protein